MVKVFNFEDNPNEFSANTYVIGKIGMKCLIVDIGSTRDDIISYIEKHYEGVAGILLTHAHFDHIRGLPKILKRFKNVPVYLASEDVPLLNNPSILSLLYQTNSLTVLIEMSLFCFGLINLLSINLIFHTKKVITNT